jgi:hypothetical protein
MANLSLVRIARLVLPVAAIGLAVLLWRQWGVDADADADRAVQRSIAAMVTLRGSTGTGDQASVTLDDGRYEFLTVIVHFRCTPAVQDVWAFYDGERPDRPTDRDAGGVLRLRHHGTNARLPHRWHGVSDLDIDARYDRRRFTGTLSARLELDAHGVRALCRSGRVRIDLPSAAPRRQVFQ